MSSALPHIGTLNDVIAKMQADFAALSAARKANGDTAAQQQAFMQLLLQLRHLNRVAQEELIDQRQKLQTRKDELDTAHLRVENLRFEKLYMQRQIRQCQTVEHVYKTVDLLPEEEFFAQLGEDEAAKYRHMEIDGDDGDGDGRAYELTKARLLHEEGERKKCACKFRLAQRRDELKKVISAQNRKKKEWNDTIEAVDERTLLYFNAINDVRKLLGMEHVQFGDESRMREIEKKHGVHDRRRYDDKDRESRRGRDDR